MGRYVAFAGTVGNLRSLSSPLDAEVSAPVMSSIPLPFPLPSSHSVEELQAAASGSDPETGDWRQWGRCAETDPDEFFPEKGSTTRHAKRICAGCEVRTQCLDYALEADERFGIWGGTSERERRLIRRERAAEGAAS
jgi:WhiB family transcriptional regulator, redox-sensing transcriptional regulator